MKIWYQKMTPTRNPRYLTLLQENIRKVKGEGTTVDVKIPQTGLWKHETIPYGYFRLLNDREIMAGLMQSQREGYDGAIIASFRDNCLDEARETLDIPVVGPGEASMLLALVMGQRFGVVAIHPKSVLGVEENIERYGFRKRTIHRPVRSLSLTLQEQVQGLEDPARVIADFSDAGRGLVRDGAEVVICACCMISPILERAGIRELEGAPIINCVNAAVKMAELLIALKDAGIPWISRKGTYTAPNEDMIRDVEELFPYLGSPAN